MKESIINMYKLAQFPKKWLEHYCVNNKIKIVGDGVMFGKSRMSNDYFWNKVAVEHSEFLTKYTDLAADFNNKNEERVPLKGMNKNSKDLDAVIKMWFEDDRHQYVQEVMKEIKYDPVASDASLREWLRLVTKKDDPVDLGILKHVIQQIKRKMLGLEVEYHTFLIIVGPQEAGKSKAIRKLTEPLAELRLEYTVDQIADKSIIGSFQSNYVVVFDEMASAGKTDMEALKRMVTALTVSGRAPYARVSGTVRQNSTFIGSSNVPVYQILRDPTGMRRFYQLNAQVRKDSEYALMDNLDMLSAFKCVDEHAQNEYLKSIKQQVGIRQMAMTAQDPFALWLDEHIVKVGENDTLVNYKNVQSLFASYAEWVDANGFQYSGNSNTFGKHLHESGLESVRKVYMGRKYTLYKVSENCSVRDNDVIVSEIVKQENVLSKLN